MGFVFGVLITFFLLNFVGGFLLLESWWLLRNGGYLDEVKEFDEN